MMPPMIVRKGVGHTELVLLVGLFLIYNLNLRQVSSFDTYASRFVPVSVLTDGDLSLDELFPELSSVTFDRADASGYFVRVRGRLYDSHPPVAPLLAVPVYALPVWTGLPRDPRVVANLFSKVAASIMAALSALAIFATVRRVVAALAPSGPPGRLAVFATVAYALGTPVWSTASQALWSHTSAVLGYAAALWGLVAGWPALAGVAAAAAVLSRPATAPAAALLMAFAAHRAWRRLSRSEPSSTRWWTTDAVRFGMAAAVVGGIGIAYNIWLFGNPVGGAPFRTAYWLDQLGTPSMFAGSLVTGLAGLTVSPSRGLFVFSPVLLLAAAGAVMVWRARPPSVSGPADFAGEVWLLGRYAVLAAVAIVLTYSKFIVWWGGHGYGPRYLTDGMPFFGLLLGFGVLALYRLPRPGARRFFQASAACLLTLALAIQAIGAFCWPSPWTLDDPPYAERLWSWKESQIIYCIRSGPRLDPMAARLLRQLGLGGSS